MTDKLLDRRGGIEKRIVERTRLINQIETACREIVLDGRSLDELDPGGTILASVHAVLGLASKDADFDLTLSVGPDPDWGLRVHRVQDSIEVSAVTWPATPALQPDRSSGDVGLAPTSETDTPLVIGTSVVGELADILRSF